MWFKGKEYDDVIFEEIGNVIDGIEYCMGIDGEGYTYRYLIHDKKNKKVQRVTCYNEKVDVFEGHYGSFIDYKNRGTYKIIQSLEEVEQLTAYKIKNKKTST